MRRILALRPNAIGDFMFALPALHALRHTYPEARIVFLGKQWHADFLRGRPGPIDDVIVMPPIPGVGAAPDAPHDSDARRRLMLALGEARFDLAIQMYGGGRYSNAFMMGLGAALTVGTRAPGAAALDRSIPYGAMANRRLELLQVVALAGAYPGRIERELEVTADDRRGAELALPRVAGERLVLLHPGASDPRRCWAPAHYAAVGDALAGKGATVAISCADSEAGLARAVARGMRHPVADLAGKLPLPALCGLLERAAMIISNDTGPLHLAMSIGTPAVGVFWFSNLIESWPLRQQLLRPVVSARIHCPVCGVANRHTRCAHDVSFVDDVTPDEVIALAFDLFEVGAQTCE